MTTLNQIKTTFTAGQLSRALLGRSDLRAYENGALTLENVRIHPTGGVSRRRGLYYVDSLDGDGRLVAFTFSTTQTYLLVFTDYQMDVYAADLHKATKTTPWSLAQLSGITWTQSADTLIVTHPDVAPYTITRTSDTAWSIDLLIFAKLQGFRTQPMARFSGTEEITLNPSASSGSITLTASRDVFTSDHVEARFRLHGGEVKITAVTNGTTATADVKENLSTTTATEDWTEAAFSDARGWPRSVTFHQDRLVFGGSRDLPNRIWLSKSGDIYNFDLGDGLDDEAIEFTILSDQVNAITAVTSSRHLLIFTSGAEWMVTGAPLTPSSIQVTRQTRIGSYISRTLPPQNVDGATLFINRSRDQLREFVYTDIEQAYQATDLAVLARDVLKGPRDLDFDPTNRLLLMPLDDGDIAVLTLYRSEQVSAWSRYTTNGDFRAVAVLGGDVYVIVCRDSVYMLERFDGDVNTDSALIGESGIATASWSGLDHLDGQTIKVVGDGAVLEDETVASGSITSSASVSELEAGLGFTHTIESLPPNLLILKGAGKAIRLVEATFRLEETQSLTLDVGQGLQPVTLASGSPLPEYSGDKRVRAIGWHQSADTPLWKIQQDTPLKFTLLTVTMDIKVND